MPLLQIDDLLLGILAARLYIRLHDRQLGKRLGHWLVPAAVGATLVAVAQPSLVFSAWSWDAMYALPATALILGLGLAPRTAIARLLALRAVVFLGEASFAFYLVHHPLVVGLGADTWESGVSARSLRPTTARAAPTTRQCRPVGSRGPLRHDLRHPEMTPPGPESLDGRQPPYRSSTGSGGRRRHSPSRRSPALTDRQTTGRRGPSGPVRPTETPLPRSLVQM